MLNENGFYRLTPTCDINRLADDMFTRATEPAKNSKKKSTKAPKFKRSSWKYSLWKKLTKWRSSKFSEDFHFVKQTNYLVYKTKGDQYQLEPFNSKIKKSRLEKLSQRESWVFVNSYDKDLMKVPLKSYMKLIQIDKISIEYHLLGTQDDDEIIDIYDNTIVIDNINDLAEFIKAHRAGINGVYDIQSYCCSYMHYDFKFRMVVAMRDGSCKTYKNENDFMKEFGLFQF